MAKKKNKLPPFVAVFRSLLKDENWRSLSGSAKVVYIYMRSKYNNRTYDEVSLSYREMEDMYSHSTLSRAFKELQKKGFIKKEKRGGLYGGVTTYLFTGEFSKFLYY